jgi:hypothetical protein
MKIFLTEGVLNPDNAKGFNILADQRWLSALEGLRRAFTNNDYIIDLENIINRVEYTNYVKQHVVGGLAVLTYEEWLDLHW